MLRLGPAPLFGLAFAATHVAGPRLAQAEPASPAPAAAQTPATAPGAGQPAQLARSGIELLARMGWGASTDQGRKLTLSPYGASVGLDVGYSWQAGFRLGGYVGYSLGRSVSQQYDPLIGSSFDVTADTSSVSAGLSIGYDVPLCGFVLRYTLGLGATAMHWDFGSTPGSAVSYAENPTVTFHIAPGATLFWPFDPFEGGVGFRYLVQTYSAIPSGFLGELIVGVRL
jgi:hypothetical protein